MKPNFALSLSFDGISLLHRAAGGWREVGEVSVTTEDLAAELAVLRQTAVGLEPGGVRSKLIIPESQIKYVTIETPGLSADARRNEAAKALENATPYEVEDLVYDISQDGPLTHIAAVARETLEEAETFAQEHRFHPVSFVAVPGDADYLGEPFFGTTSLAEDLLESGEHVEPDGVAVVVIGLVEPLQETSADPAPPPTPAPETPDDTPRAAPGPDAETALPEDTVIAADDHPPEAPPLSDGDVTDAEASADPDDAENEITEQSQDAEAGTSQKPTSDTTTDVLAAAVAKASISQAQSAAAPPAPAPAPPPAPEPRKPTVSATRKVSAPTANADATRFSTRRATLGGATRAAPRITPQPDSSSLTQQPAIEDVQEAVVVATPARTGFFSRRKPRKGAAAPKPAPSTNVPPPDTEVERMTVFGARSGEVGGKPRFLGLILTVVLLVFLAGVAAWAAVFLDEGIAGLLRKDETRATASASDSQIDPQVIRDADATPESATPVTDTQVAVLDPVLSAEDSAVLDVMKTERAVPEIPVITPQEAAARYAVSGIWPLAPANLPQRPAIDSAMVFRNGIDATSSAVDAIALPAPERFGTDLQMAAVPSPPPFGQRAETRADGLLIPTRAGIVTPQGYTLIAASPPLKPPLAPTRFSAAPEETPNQPDAEAEISQANVVLAAFRPLPRPSGLAETNERAQLGGVTRSELAAFRPAVRPRSLQDRAREAEEQARQSEEQARAAAAATAAAAAALALPPADPQAAAIESATRFAVAQSRRPDTRPRNFDRIVQRAQTASPQRETQVAATGTVAPRTVAPKIPSKASVARSATVKNAINLRKVNLIGIYGKPASRRALVRLSNGRYKKVKVGDRIDGGRVAAIGDSELRYTKGGRNVVLKMPRG